MKLRTCILFFSLTLAWLASVTTGHAQSLVKLTELHVFDFPFQNSVYETSPSGPEGSLVQGSDGSFYGTTEAGGKGYGSGTVFKITAQGVFTVLHEFNGTDGNEPFAGLVTGTDGNLYGTTTIGGQNGSGTIFEITPSGTFTNLYSFSAGVSQGNAVFLYADGQEPQGLTQGSDGNFYGVATYGGTGQSGTIFRFSAAGGLSVLHHFSAMDANGLNSDGAYPCGALVQGEDGNFYGTTTAGGAGGKGTVFSLTTAGVFTVLHSFGATDAKYVNADGAHPQAGLIRGGDGNFYGTTEEGGPGGSGTVYKITPAGVLTTVYAFSMLDPGNANADGAYPQAGLSQGRDGNFYGLTDRGGLSQAGTAFRLTPGGVLTVLHTFNHIPSNHVNAEGADPQWALVQGSDGNFYGTTGTGAANGSGAIFQLTPSGAITDLYSFTTTQFPYENYGGSEPNDGLVQTSDGTLYGTTHQGDPDGQGTVFVVKPNGQLGTLHDFTAVDARGVNTDGAMPNGGVVLGGDGNFYGTTQSGGTAGLGTVFQITPLPQGRLTSLHSFTGADGDEPVGLVLGNDGNFYGLTSRGGAHDEGTAFRITTAGVLTTLHEFDGSDGANPVVALTLGRDGNFYGTTISRGANGTGTIFQMTPAGVVTTLHNFGAYYQPYEFTDRNDDGIFPRAPLTEGSDGNFYGTTNEGGAYGGGTFFKITPGGVFTNLYSFGSNGVSSNALAPTGKLLQLGDGNFYGTTEFGGPDSGGAIFQMTPTGTLTILYTFTLAVDSGEAPTTGLTLGSDGNIYGSSFRTIFRFALDVTHPAFFAGETNLGGSVYYLAFPGNGNVFGYYNFYDAADSHYLYHYDLGFEYVFDANDGHGGVYLYDFKSNTFWYTSPTFAFPYLYDFSLQAFLYYYPDPTNPGHYNTNGVRYFYNFSTGKIISK